MTRDELGHFLKLLDEGATLRVPFSVTLYPDTCRDRSFLRRRDPDHFELITKFYEFAAGHGYSLEQTEREEWTRARVETQLLATGAEHLHRDDEMASE